MKPDVSLGWAFEPLTVPENEDALAYPNSAFFPENRSIINVESDAEGYGYSYFRRLEESYGNYSCVVEDEVRYVFDCNEGTWSSEYCTKSLARRLAPSTINSPLFHKI